LKSIGYADFSDNNVYNIIFNNLRSINNDILEELKQLLQNQKTYPVDVTGKNMLTIANSCQDVTQDIVHLGWDYGWQDDPKRNAKQMSVIAQN
jgi:hypothetical protein